MREKIFTFLIFLVSFVTLNSNGETLLGTQNRGDPVSAPSGASKGMGGISIATEKSAFAICANPALASRFERPQLAVSILPFVLNEERSNVIYDKFSQRVYNIYAANTSISFNNVAFAAVYPVKVEIPFLKNVSVGAGIVPVYDFSYNFERSERDKSYVVTSSTRVENSGAISKTAIGVSVKPVEWLSAGISFNLHSGLQRSFIESLYPLETSRNYKSTVSKTISGNSISIGLLSEINQRFTAGLNYQTSSRMTFKGESDESRVTYPSVVSLGIEYQPPSLLSTRVGADVLFTRWGDDFKVDGASSSFRNTLEVRFGVEHYVKNNIPVRFGLSYVPWYGNKNVATIMFTAGTGARYKKMKFDIGGGVGKREYYISSGAVEPDLVEEFFSQFGLTVGYVF
ncbi:MAG: hypothetical protein AB1633_04720 [Elusimicrobiota bacterium]